RGWRPRRAADLRARPRQRLPRPARRSGRPHRAAPGPRRLDACGRGAAPGTGLSGCAGSRHGPHLRFPPTTSEEGDMSNPQTPTDGIDLPEDPEEPVTALEPDTGEDYDPPEVVDLDREASEADQ